MKTYSFPIYDEPDYTSNDYRDDAAGFHDYVEHLLDNDQLDKTNSEYEIFEKIISYGTESLTDKELDIVEEVINRDWPNCVLCGEKLGWEDIIFKVENDGMCSTHIGLIDLNE